MQERFYVLMILDLLLIIYGLKKMVKFDTFEDSDKGVKYCRVGTLLLIIIIIFVPYSVQTETIMLNQISPSQKEVYYIDFNNSSFQYLEGNRLKTLKFNEDNIEFEVVYHSKDEHLIFIENIPYAEIEYEKHVFDGIFNKNNSINRITVHLPIQNDS